MSLLLLGVLCLVFAVLAADPPVPSPPWIALFLNQDDQQRCLNRFAINASKPKITYCDHSTIVFNPNTTAPWQKFYGSKEKLTVLAYGRDENAEAIMVYAFGGPVYSNNSFPHITTVAAVDGPYSALYSNVLWARFVSHLGLQVKTGPMGKPQGLSFPDGKVKKWEGILPPYISPEFPLPNGQPYPATAAYLSLADIIKVDPFVGVLCQDSLWNDTTKVCNVK